jgi:hypothetical protein
VISSTTILVSYLSPSGSIIKSRSQIANGEMTSVFYDGCSEQSSQKELYTRIPVLNDYIFSLKFLSVVQFSDLSTCNLFLASLPKGSLLTKSETRFFIVKSFNEDNVLRCVEDVSLISTFDMKD